MRLPALALIGLIAATPVAGETFFEDGFEARPSKSGLGVNLESVIDFASAYPFTDFFKQSRPWITASPGVFDTDQRDQLDLDDEGWVRSLPPCDPGNPQQFCIARTVINSGNRPYPDGRYLVLYDGDGTLEYGLGASRVVAESAPGRDVVQVNGNSIWQLDVRATAAPPNHIRNIRIFPPGFDPAQSAPPRFHPDFLAELAPYRTLRFMDWMETNGGFTLPGPNSQQEFGDRPEPSDAHWSIEGVPVEIMVELSNETGAEPWFTLAHRVDDDYVARFARIVRDQLRSDLEVYVEYSNEVWNPQFGQGAFIEDQGNQRYGGLGDPFIRRLNYHGQRTAEICDIFRSEFGAAASRVVCVLGAQAANAFTQTEAADCPIAVQAGERSTPCREAIDAVAIAPYFANYTNVPANETDIVTWDLDILFAELTAGGQLAQNLNTPCTENGNAFSGRVVAGRCTVPALEEVTLWMDNHFNAAQARGLRMIAYEGGQHLVLVQSGNPNNNDATQQRRNTITELFIAANRDPRMGPIYQQYLGEWKARGGELFATFSLSGDYTRFGSWGIVEHLKQVPRPPKAQAIDDFNAANPCWWSGCAD